MEQTDKEQLKTETSNEVTVGNTFLEFLIVTVKYRWFLFWFVFIITASATVFALLSPKWYKSTTSVLPAERTDFLSAFSGLSALAKNFSPSKGLAALTGNTEFDRYMAILKSSTLIDEVIKKFKLREEYEMEDAYYEKVVKQFLGNFEMEVQDEGNLTLSIYDKDPQRAADIANYMIKRLNDINTELSVKNAKANREFIEKRYFQNIADINNLETKMKQYQEKYGVIAVPEQIETTIKSMATIYAELAKKEIELNVVKRMYGEKSPLTTNAKIEVEEIQNKINQLSTGNGADFEGANLLIPFKQAPKLANEYLKIFRNIEIQYKILEFVQPLYEQAKVEEVRNSPSVLVLDKAGPADRKSKPKGSLYAVLSFVLSLGFGFFIIFTKELFVKYKVQNFERYNFIMNSLKSDLGKINFWKR